MKGNSKGPARLPAPRDPHALARMARAIQRQGREERRIKQRRRQASTLGWLEDSVLGYRMPAASRLIADSEWARDALEAYCWRCGTTRVPYEDVRNGCACCRGRRMEVRGVPLRGVVRLGRYAPPLSQWVPAIKQRAWRDMGVTLGRELGEQVAEAIACGRIPRPHAVVSVPVHWLRRTLRGIDHTATLADEVARVIGVARAKPLRATLALRQTGGSRDRRVGNSGRYRPTGGPLDAGQGEVLIVDDVRTTGSTLFQCARALAGHGVSGISLAVCAAADPPDRSNLAVGGSKIVDKF